MSVKISACTITKNEEENIAISINSYKDYVDEIIIVDTGSTDNTVEIAKSLGAKVIGFEWINDFSAAKNCALNNSTGDWILFLDADEWIKDDGAKNLQSAIKDAEGVKINSISFEMLNLNDNGVVIEAVNSMRLFKNRECVRFKRKIHEILFDFEANKTIGSLFCEKIILNHSGYADKILNNKTLRNSELLEKNFAQGISEPIDYFYMAREHIVNEKMYTKEILNLMLKDKDYKKKLSNVNISNNIENLKVVAAMRLKNEYSLDERLSFIEEAIADDPKLPTYYYHKYLVLTSIGELDKQDLLVKALELDKVYKNKITNNGFYKHKSDIFNILGRKALILNDHVKALDYYSQAIQLKSREEVSLRALLYIISGQNKEEIIAFINSLFDIESERDLKYIVWSLRLTQNLDVFLYYFVKLYKLTGEADISFFTSKLILGEFLEVANKYLTIYLESREEKAQILVAGAVIVGKLKSFYEEKRNFFSEEMIKILNAFFTEYKLKELDDKSEGIISKIIDEVAFIIDEETINKIINIFEDKEKIRRLIIEAYFGKHAYDIVIRECNKFIEEDLNDTFAGEVTALLGLSYFKKLEDNYAILYLEQAITLGYLNVEVFNVYRELVEKYKRDRKPLDVYKKLLKKYLFAHELLTSNVISDEKRYNYKVELKKLKTEFSEQYSLIPEFADVMFEFADKNYDFKNFYIAEDYYKLLIKCKHNEDLCYYKLGSIYNSWGFIEESYYCYEMAFINNLKLSAKILPKEHKNFYYIFSKKKYEPIKSCPICGTNAELKACYEFLDDENLSLNKPFIAKYRFCKECNHIFSENQEIYEQEINVKEEYTKDRVSNAYDIHEKLKDLHIEKMLLIDNKKELYQVINKEYNVIYKEVCLENENILTIKDAIKRKDNLTLVLVLSNFESAFELCSNKQKPLWVEVDKRNVFSKKSIKKLLENSGFNNILCYDSKFLYGKMIVIANYESRG